MVMVMATMVQAGRAGRGVEHCGKPPPAAHEERLPGAILRLMTLIIMLLPTIIMMMSLTIVTMMPLIMMRMLLIIMMLLVSLTIIMMRHRC